MSPTDYTVLAIAALLAGLTLAWRERVAALAGRLAQNAVWSMVALAILPVALRLFLLPNFPVPTPSVSDDFSYLLIADTLRHLRLANPVHPMHEFFETFFVLQEPTYSSIFPMGQGVELALGWTLFGLPWAGVLVSAGALSACCYWMLRGWIAPVWALAGGVLTAIQFGPLNQWTNSYWGGAVSATAGCLVFGALPRLRAGAGRRNGVLLGVGLLLQMLTRPFESLVVLAAAVIFLRGRRMLIPFGFVVLGLAATAAQNKAVTGSFTTLPYQVSRYQYGVPTTFTFQPNPIPHRPLTREQQLDYEAQSQIHGPGTDTPAAYGKRLLDRVRYYRFFFLVPLYVALPFFVPSLRDRRFVWVALTLLLFALATNFYPYFYSHYIAAATCLFVLVSVKGLERLHAIRPEAAHFLLIACFAHFLFWYGLHVAVRAPFSAPLRQYETWDAINQGDPEGRIAIHQRLSDTPGEHLVFVRYWPRHTFDEWVHNGADIDSSRIVWARDLGPEQDQQLIRYYPRRTVWLLEPDASPPRLTPYPGR